MIDHPRQAAARSDDAETDDGPYPAVPVYLEYPPAGWPDALPPRRKGRDLLRWHALKRRSIVTTGALY